MTPELETLDQLNGNDMPLLVIQQVYPCASACAKGVLGLLTNGDVRLLASDGTEIPKWRWRELFTPEGGPGLWAGLTLSLTDQGAQKMR